jgi:hypothetical protein
MSVKYVDIEYLRAQNANVGQLILAGTSNTLTYTQYVTVDINGNVGIGTSRPTDTLSVQGNVHLLGSGSVVIFPDGSNQNTAGYPSVGSPGAVQFAGPSSTFNADSANLVWDSGNLRLGIGTSTPVTTLQIKYTAMESTSTSWSGTGPVVLDSFSAMKVRSAHYFVQVTDEEYSQYHTSQITVVQDGVRAYKSEYNLVTSAEKLGDFDCLVIGGQLQLIFVAYQATNKTVKITRTSMTA